jgi:hypothetical protein
MSSTPPALPGPVDEGRRFDVFLSHRYQSPEVNLYFYEAISSASQVTFRVDRGTVSTSTTRLERMIRDADAFIGVFPIPGDPQAAHDRAALLDYSRYFRLELDMAIRSKKPAAVFYDRRYGNTFKMPPSIVSFPYNAQDISWPSSATQLRLQRIAEMLFSHLAASVRAEAAKREVDYERDLVGVLLPEDDSCPGLAAAARELLSEQSLEPLELSWPPRLDAGSLTQLRRCDWIILDTSAPASEVLLAFSHGQFIPTLRTRRAANADGSGLTPSITEEVLFGALEVGYRKDVISWHTKDDLLTGLTKKIGVLRLEPELIGNSSRAADYFASAAKRKERVFLSYAGEDADQGTQFAAELGKHFQEVFDYRAPTALRPGDPWIDQLFEQLSAAAVGVLLISSAYQESRYCMDEARTLYDAYQQGKLMLLPVKLDDAAPPAFLTGVQYERLRQRSPEQIVGDLLARLRK